MCQGQAAILPPNIKLPNTPVSNLWDDVYGNIVLPNLVQGTNTITFENAGSNPILDVLRVYVPSSEFSAPDAPTNLNAPTASISNTGFTLNWTASTNTHGTVTGYDVYRDGVKVNTALITGTSYTATGLTQGTSYAMSVKARTSGASESDATTLTVATTGSSSVQISGLTLTPASSDMFIGTSKLLWANITPLNASNKTLTWISSNSNIASVDADGKVTANNAGIVTIRATTKDGSNISASAEVIVMEQWFKIDDNDAGVGSNYTMAFNAPAGLRGWQDYSSSLPLYRSREKAAVSDGSQAVFTFTGDKVRLITRYGADLGIAQVIIDNQAPVNVDLYNAQNITQQVVYTSPTLTPGSHTLKVTRIGQTNGTPGTTPFISIDAFEFRELVGSNGDAIRVTRIDVTPPNQTVTQGATATVQYNKNITPNTATVQAVKWTSSNTNVATIDASSGLATIVGQGTTTIKATARDGSNVFGQTRLDVNPGSSTTPVTSITVNAAGGATSVTEGSTLQLSKTVNPSGATYQNVTWSSNSPNATVDANGLVRGVTPSATPVRITARTTEPNSTVFGFIDLTVTSVPLVDRTDAASSPAPRISASNETYGASTKAFDNSTTLGSWAASGTRWIQFQFSQDAATRYTIREYTITSTANGAALNQSPKDWILYGTNTAGANFTSNPGAFTQVDSETGVTFTTTNQKLRFTVATPGSYAAYTLVVTATAGTGTGYTQVNEIELFGPNGTNGISSVAGASQLQLNQNTVAEKITVFPNPVTDGWITVGLNSADKNNKLDVSVADLSGKIVYKSSFTSNGISERLNLGNVQAGVYVIRITGANTKFSSKVIVQ
jgi:uncharacterized protein YjdB